MATPLDIDDREDSEIVHQTSNNHWYWIALALVVMILTLILLARPGTGVGANSGPAASDATNNQAAVRTNGAPSPNAPASPAR